MGTQLPFPKNWQRPPIFGLCLLWPNGCTDQDAAWYGDKSRLRPHCLRWGPSSLSPKRGHSPPTFGPCLFWPNGWMDQDATWYDGRPGPGQHCVRCGPSSTPKGHSPQFRPMSVCGQTARWIKISLGRQVGLGPGRIVLHGDPDPPFKRGIASNFRPMSIVVKRSPISATAEHLLYLLPTRIMDNFLALNVK